MSEARRNQGANVVQLAEHRAAADQQQRGAQQAGQVRHQLSLLQGYAELMQGLSPGQQAHVLRIMAEKSRALTALLAPFLVDDQSQRPPIEHYRQARQRSRQLVAHYRTLLDHLQEIIEAPSSASG